MLKISFLKGVLWYLTEKANQDFLDVFGFNEKCFSFSILIVKSFLRLSKDLISGFRVFFREVIAILDASSCFSLFKHEFWGDII